MTSSQLDFASLLGSVFAVIAVLGAQWLVGGSVGQLVEISAALIVLGGTLGATLVSFSVTELRRAFQMIPRVFFHFDSDLTPLIKEIVNLATVARKDGLLAIEAGRASLSSPLLKKGVKYVIDGFDPATVRDILEAEIVLAQQAEVSAARVFEQAAKTAPKMGFLGASLGMMHALPWLSDFAHPVQLAEGLAVGVVSLVYGTGLAYLILLPWAGKLKQKALELRVTQDVVKLGILGIQEGLNPHFLQERLEVFLQKSH